MADELGAGCASTRCSRATSCSARAAARRYYLDKYRFETRPELLGPLGERLAAAVREHEPDAVRLAGPALGAVALAASASLASGLPFVIVRDAAKEYGTANRLEGPFEAGELVCLLEDVVTSGGALAEAVAAARGRARRPARGLRRRPRGGGADALARIGVRLRSLYRRATSPRPQRPPKIRMVEPLESLRQSDPAVRVAAGFRTSHEQEEWYVTKQEFVDAVASRANLSRRDAGAAVDAVLDTVTDALKKRDTITFTGFGKFSTSERARARASIPAIRARRCRSRRRPCRSSRPAAS